MIKQPACERKCWLPLNSIAVGYHHAEERDVVIGTAQCNLPDMLPARDAGNRIQLAPQRRVKSVGKLGKGAVDPSPGTSRTVMWPSKGERMRISSVRNRPALSKPGRVFNNSACKLLIVSACIRLVRVTEPS
jgi:hypothetical protein